jgi:hypothetical protein
MMIFLISIAFGAVLTLAVVLVAFKVQTKEAWQRHQIEMNAQRTHTDKLTAENSKLRVALAAGEMTQDAKKVAAMTMAALDAIIGSEKVA